MIYCVEKGKNKGDICANCRNLTIRKKSYKYVTLLQKNLNGYIIKSDTVKMNGEIIMGEKNYQSIGNYSYNRRRNREPVQNGNDFNFSNGNNNSQPPQNNYNNGYGQPQQNNYSNDYGQPQQKIMPTYQGYDTPMPESYSGGHRAVEVPIPKKMKKSEIVTLTFILIPFLSMFLILGISGLFGYNESFNIVMPICMLLSIVGAISSIIVGVVMEDRRLKRVCTVPVTGHLVGYDTKIVHVHRKHGPNTYYHTYAPKYEIFINNRYEIRTLNDYKKSSNFLQQRNLLANLDGYEIIRSGKIT